MCNACNTLNVDQTEAFAGKMLGIANGGGPGEYEAKFYSGGQLVLDKKFDLVP